MLQLRWLTCPLLLLLSIRSGLTFPPYAYDDDVEDVDEDLASFDYYKALAEELEERRGGGGGVRGTGCGEEDGVCAEEQCPVTRGCRAGVVRDRCGCCWECGNLEGQACDAGNNSVYYGLCGEKLECRAEAHEPHEPQCVCVTQEPLCGSDGQTYMNICKFNEAAFSDPAMNATEGPCKTVPVIKVPPRNLVNVTGSSAVFLCEVFAYPMALVEWRKDGNEVILPGDDPHVSVQSRGGPQKYELSSWLQIEEASRADSGTYRCIAKNEVGDVSATAVLGILPPDEMSAYLEENIKDLTSYDQMRYYDEDYY